MPGHPFGHGVAWPPQRAQGVVWRWFQPSLGLGWSSHPHPTSLPHDQIESDTPQFQEPAFPAIRVVSDSSKIQKQTKIWSQHRHYHFQWVFEQEGHEETSSLWPMWIQRAKCCLWWRQKFRFRHTEEEKKENRFSKHCKDPRFMRCSYGTLKFAWKQWRSQGGF